MIKQELIEKICRYFRINQFEAEKIFDDIFTSIMHGVKEDRVVEISNFGEFLMKYNGEGKSVEFLANAALEDEVNTYVKPAVTSTQADYHRSVEEQIRKKKEAILNQISSTVSAEKTTNGFEYKSSFDTISKFGNEPEKQGEKKEEIIHTENFETSTEIDLPDKLPNEEEIKKKEIHEESAHDKVNLPVPPEEVKKDAIYETGHTELKPNEELESIGSGFSDYFSEVESKPEEILAEEKQEIIQPSVEQVSNVIPRQAVDLHNEITSHPEEKIALPVEKIVAQEEKIETPVQDYTRPPVENVDILPEHKLDDSSYYIWYKDSASTPAETQTLSYEYELLYQAQKEAEYKSKLKIYVTTFILFFSFVLILLIFSPVIYRIFFTPTELQKVEYVPEDKQENNLNGNVPNQEKANKNVITENAPVDTAKPKTQNTQQEQTNNQTGQQTQTTEPPKQTENKQTPPPQQTEQKSQQQEVQKTPPQTETKIDGLVKTGLGWTDEKYKVIYIQLENGKFTIQESAWDSEVKAGQRIKTVQGLNIPGLTGNIIKADLGGKGVWYRARFGEFGSVEEARKKAEELRGKEQGKLHALLMYLLLYT